MWIHPSREPALVACVCAFTALGCCLTLLTPRTGLAQRDGTDPCLAPEIMHHRQRGEALRLPLLYDGVAPLARSPAMPIRLPTDFAGNVCMLLNVRITERGGTLYVDDAGFMGAAGPGVAMQLRRTNVAMQAVRNATQVVRDALAQSVFREQAQAGKRYMIAVPYRASHPLYATGTAVAAAPGAGSAAGVPPTLAARGFPEGTLARVADDLWIYTLGERGNSQHFAIVRTLAPTEPILGYVESNDQPPFRVYRYSDREQNRFLSYIVPLLRDRGQRFTEAVIYHYARGVTINRQPDSRFPWNSERHFQTGAPIEVPAAVERWDGRRRESGGPYMWYAGGERGTSATDLNTLASIQTVQHGIAETQRGYAEARAALYAKEAAELAARRAARRARDATRRAVLTAAGLVYRAPDTWSRYALGPEMQAVFDGDWPSASTQWQFGALYARTIRAFSNRCRHLIPAGSPMQTERWVTTDQSGNRWARDGSDTTFIPVAFVQPYRWWDTRSPLALPVAPQGLRANNVTDFLALIATLSTRPGDAMSAGGLLVRVQIAMREDMALLFENGCESPDVTQFMENMRRMALRLPSLQAEKAPRALPALEGWPASVEQTCRQHETERGERPNRTWCPCLAREFGQRFTLGEQWQSLEDYHRFFDEVVGVRMAPDGRPVWERYTPANACRN
jgi:hypothetical protein